MTVGEMPGASAEDAIIYTNPESKELNMIFTFEHMNLDSVDEDKWNLKDINLVDLKENFEKWQTTLYNAGWNSLYWNNHDQPRIVSRFGNDQEFRKKSAKMLAICLHMMQGTPYIYQGEEIGMTNVRFESLDEYRDIELLNMYEEKKLLGWSHKRIMEAIYTKGRDNARTPMQWNDTENAGFTKGTPWININPRYKEINVKEALADQDSIYYFYQRLIQLRKKLDIIITGQFKLILRNDPKIFAYKRIEEHEELIILCNFSDHPVKLQNEELLKELQEASVVITNDKANEVRNLLTPYEATVYSLKTVQI